MHYLTINDIETQDFEVRRIPYDVKTVIKTAIPVDKRVWEPDNKVWYFHKDYIAEVDKLIHRHTAIDSLTRLNWVRAWPVLYLKPNAPAEVVNAVADTLLDMTEDEATRQRIEMARTICLEW